MSKGKKPAAGIGLHSPPASTKKKGGRKPANISNDQRQQIEALAGLGLKHDEIATVVGFSERTLQNHCRAELSRGLVKADAAVMNNLYKIATGNTPQAAPAAIFWAKVRRRWHEVQRVIHGFDPELLQIFVKQVVDVLRRYIPDTCPHCKTNLDLKPKIAGELRELSKKMIERLPASEIVPMVPTKEGGGE